MVPGFAGRTVVAPLGAALSEREPDPGIAQTLEELMAGLRHELEERLEAYRSRLETALTEALRPTEPPEPAAEEDGTLALVEALRAIDEGSSQSQILRALLRRSLRYANRVALLLTPGGDYLVWGTEGFAPATNGPSDDRFAAPAEGPWREALSGHGQVELSADDCALLCHRLESPLPDGGVLVPFILQGRLAAVVYADHAPGAELDTHGVSVLAWAAARAIEALPFRERPAVAMLRPAGDVATDEPAIPLWTPPEEPEAEPAGEAAVKAEGAVEDVAEEVTAAEAEVVVAPTETEAAVEESVEPESLSPTEAPEPARAEDEYAPPEDDTEPMMRPWSTSPGVVEAPPEDLTEPETAEPADESTEDAVTEPEVAPVEDAAATPGAPTESRQEPVMSDAEAERAPSSEFEVMPPSDVSGPGWAFTTGGASDDEEAFHAEAKRLARLLVSEIKLYHEVDVWEGRRKGNVYSELQGEIDRSRQLFDERVDEEIRAKRDYFYEELVRQLADGNADVLGI